MTPVTLVAMFSTSASTSRWSLPSALLIQYIGGRCEAPTSTSAPDVALKVTAVTPVTRAATVLSPGASPSVSRVCARPLLFVVALAGETLPPPAVTANLTVTPDTGSSFSSITSTTSGLASRAPGFTALVVPGDLYNRIRGFACGDGEERRV